ncbi:hypothetical protein HN375_02555 [bacterium]|nr:hypothetical protein [bacterium]MBT3730349.1 hypothetical protein [bacterium]
MFNISDYLSKFKNITPPDKFVKDELVAVVKEVVGVEIEKDSIDVRNGTVFLSVDPIIKNEIFLRKTEVLESLREKLKSYKKTVRDLH